MALNKAEKRIRNNIASKKWRTTHPERHLERSRKNNKRLSDSGWYKNYTLKKRTIVLEFYSKGKPHCSCCGEDKYQFLAIDHINGGGRIHLKEIGGDICGWIIKNNFPEGFRVLCHNCNMARGLYGNCPHENT